MHWSLLEEGVMDSPAIHLLRLQVAPVFEQLNVVEEEPNHAVSFVQIPLHLNRVLRWFPGIQETDILQQMWKSLHYEVYTATSYFTLTFVTLDQ